MKLTRDILLNSMLTCILVAASTSLQAQQGNPERDAYFGETHVHTSWSLDAFAIGNVLTNPGDAYKYFKGEPIKHPLGYDAGRPVTRAPARRRRSGRCRPTTCWRRCISLPSAFA